MKKIFFLIIVMIFLEANTKAQTHIDQSYFGTNLPAYTWNVAGSPYEVMGDIEIHCGSNLIIEPGVVVLFQGHYKMDVKGSINAFGTDNNRITITSINENLWNGIRFDFSDGTIPAKSKFHYCDISNAQKTGTDCQNPDPESSGGAIYVEAFSDLEIIECEIFNNSVQAHGGAIVLFEGSSPLISNNSIHDNFAIKRGGGIAMFRSCNPSIINNNLFKNEAKKGGGAIFIGVINQYYSPCNPDLIGNTFTQNNASGLQGTGGWYGSGGALGICSSNPFLQNNTFEQNSAYIDGGAIHIERNSVVNIENNTFSDNRTGYNGGSIYITGSLSHIDFCQFSSNTAINGGSIYTHNSELSAQNCTFTENAASSDGGGVYSTLSVLILENCIFEENIATGNGGGVFLLNPFQDLQSDISSINLSSFKNNIAYQGSGLYLDRTSNYSNNTYVMNNLFAENYATDKGVVYLQGDNKNTVFNHNTVTNNSATYFISGVCVERDAYFPLVDATHKNFHNNIIFESVVDLYITYTYYSPINYQDLAVINYLNYGINLTYPFVPPIILNPNPHFVSTTDYHLSWPSPCINVGDNTASQTSVDLDGNNRIANNITDYGCYEYGSIPPAARKAKPSIIIDDSQVDVFPNPASDFLTISLPTEENMEISIFTLSGQRVYYQENTLVNNKFVIPMTNIQPGIYLLKLTKSEQIITKRIVIQ